MQSTKEKVSYCLGLETGKSLKAQFAELDNSLLKEGFNDALMDTSPKLPQDEVRSIMQALRQQVAEQQKDFFLKLAEINKKEGETFLTENRKKEGVTALPSGLQYKVLQTGQGPSPRPFDVATAHVRGYFLDGRLFESTYEQGKPHSFPLNRVILGWSEALQLMHVGDKWQLFIPHYLAYGESGFGDQIGPNATLIFEVELLGINLKTV